jgi:hypothetical protein
MHCRGYRSSITVDLGKRLKELKLWNAFTAPTVYIACACCTTIFFGFFIHFQESSFFENLDFNSFHSFKIYVFKQNGLYS